MPDTIQKIVDQLLCTQCGTCVAVCPVQAIEMHETPAGMLVAQVLSDRCTSCGECRRICPGDSILLNLPDGVDPFKGVVSGAYVGHACDKVIRASGQSGGVVSGLLLYLLETDRINAALVTTMPQDGSLRPNPVLARTREEILSAQGSKYCPVASNSVLRQIIPNESIATVGISCQMHGIYNLATVHSALTAGVNYRIGLFCDRTLLYSCINQMSQNARLKVEDIAGLEYRSKARNGWPGEVCFKLHSGDQRFFPSTLRTRLKDYFTPPRCRLCFDKMNIMSDLSVGDAWGISDSATGDSVIIARNEKAETLLKDACDQGYLELEPIDIDLIFMAQSIETRRRDFTAFTSTWAEMGKAAPENKGLEASCRSSIEPSARESYKRKLLFNYRVARSNSRQKVLLNVYYRQLTDRFRLRLISLYHNFTLKLRSTNQP
ncbi:MAG: 4Fe-4S dicluster domain-containing protein, partial [Deltaproteobacteria bacterium]|nr:4Fe-4S dicluster domain-containing protein [Deltaproteobacteria bacterium]